jgi:hypothetical protein
MRFRLTALFSADIRVACTLRIVASASGRSSAPDARARRSRSTSSERECVLGGAASSRMAA